MTVKFFLVIALLSGMPMWAQAAPHTSAAVPSTKKNPGDSLTTFIARSSAPLLPQAPAGTPNPALAHQSEDAGQRVFEQNCARCHNAPEGFPPSITGTIVRHMRVRASLSQEEEQELLHFFNP
jgi:mono/diheme cytochrome c family protein